MTMNLILVYIVLVYVELYNCVILQLKSFADI